MTYQFNGNRTNAIVVFQIHFRILLQKNGRDTIYMKINIIVNIYLIIIVDTQKGVNLRSPIRFQTTTYNKLYYIIHIINIIDNNNEILCIMLMHQLLQLHTNDFFDLHFLYACMKSQSTEEEHKAMIRTKWHAHCTRHFHI